MSSEYSDEYKEMLHYLKVLQKHYGHWQEQCRNALDYAIELLDDDEPGEGDEHDPS